MEMAYEVPRSIWQWATRSYSEEICADIWQFIFMRARYNKSLRARSRVVVVFGISMLISLLTASLGWFQGLLVVTFIGYMVSSRVHCKHLQYEILELQFRNQQEWLELIVALVPLLDAYKQGDPMVTETVRT